MSTSRAARREPAPDGPEQTTPELRAAVRAYLDHLLVERALAGNTLSSYRRDLGRYQQWLVAAGVTALAQVGTGHVAEFLATLRLGDEQHPPLSVSSAARTVSAVRGLHRFAAAEGLTDGDPAHDVHPPTPGRRLPKALSVYEVEQLLAAAGAETDADPLALRDRALLEFLYGTGARISEAVGAAVDDLDLADGRTGDAAGSTVRLSGKGGKTRLVPVGGYACRAVSAYLIRARPALARAGGGHGALFLNARGGALSRQSAWSILRRAAQRARLAGSVSPHTLRHSFATHLLDGGADVRVVQELLGHASVTTTQVYTLVTVDKLREVYTTTHPRARA
ncbi:site-specific tyrosine recombinase XerD [Actinocatenispora thailandica]|nr:site-specific tyrosine recombinase XerD [Actinocatenispora thailandica]